MSFPIEKVQNELKPMLLSFLKIFLKKIPRAVADENRHLYNKAH